MENVWFESYDDGMPHTLQPYPERTLLDVVSDTARQRPDHPALLFKGARLSYGELERLSDAFAAALAAKGVEKGDRVALLMPNCPQFVIGQLGAWKAGAIAVPVNPLYTGRELSHMLGDCGAETALVLTPFYAKVKEAQPHTNLRRVIATNIKEYLPPHLRLLFSAFKEKKEGHRIALEQEDFWLADLLRHYARAARPDLPVSPSDPALFLYTGGTTGTPKAAVGTHHALLVTAIQMKTWFGELFVDWQDVTMGHMPLFHCYGNVAVLGASLVGRHPVALVPNARDLDDLVDTIRKVHPALMPGVPTLFIALLRHPKVRAGEVDFKSIKLCFSGAAPLLAETKNRFEALTGGRIVEGYALTESMVAAVVTPAYGVYKPGSVGLPLPDVEVCIADQDDGHSSLPLGEVGEILLRAPQLMQGYWQRPVETADTLREGPLNGSSGTNSGSRWLFTGDLGYMDEDGYLFIVDRKKDLIKPSGFQVWPREVEEVIASHPAVAEVGVAGIPDRLRGETVKAWVVLVEGQQVTGAELRAYCREKLVAYKVPRRVEFRDSLPKSHLGKLLRRELVREHIEGLSSPSQRRPQVEGQRRLRNAPILPVPQPVGH
jgi:long-chain acyl-CoA synthetase